MSEQEQPAVRPSCVRSPARTAEIRRAPSQALQSEMEIQIGGEGAFFPVLGSVADGALVTTARPGESSAGAGGDKPQGGGEGDGAIALPLAAVDVSKPDHERDGRPYCLKLRLPKGQKDESGHSKHVLAFSKQADVDQWLAGLSDHGSSSANLGAKSHHKAQARFAALFASLKSDPEMLARAQMAEMQALEHAGWMAKKGGLRRAWKRRYFEQSGDFLFYREDVGADVLGVVDLVKATDVRPSAHLGHKQWEIEIVTPDRTYRLECDTADSMHDWLCSLAKFSVDPEALRNWVPHTEGGTLVQNRYLVLTKATARQAPDDDSLKLGEMPEGLVVQCVEELTDAEGIERVRCCGSVVHAEAPSGGWLKKATSKKKDLVKKLSYDESARSLREQPVMVRLQPCLPVATPEAFLKRSRVEEAQTTIE